MLHYQEFVNSPTLIEPLTFERLHALKKTSNHKYRLLEESRLEQLAQHTLQNKRKNVTFFMHLLQ